MGQTKLCFRSPPPTITYHHPPPLHTTSQNIFTTIHYHSPLSITPLPTAKIYPPPPTTSQKNGPPRKSQNIFKYNLLVTLLFLFLRNPIFLSVTEILCESFDQFAFQVPNFYCILRYLRFSKVYVSQVKFARFILVIFTSKIVVLT